MSEASNGDGAFNWDPGPHAISFESFGGKSDPRRPIVVVSHPTAPFVRPCEEDWSELLMGQTAHAYLVQLNSRITARGYSEGLGLPSGWLDALDPSRPGCDFGWLPITPALSRPVNVDAARRAASHYLVRRRINDGTPDAESEILVADETVILVAGDRWIEKGIWNSTGSGFGLRVVLHLRDCNDRREITICGMTAHLPHTPYVMLYELAKESSHVVQSASGVRGFVEGAAPRIAETLQLAHSGGPDGLIFDEFRYFRHMESDNDKSHIGIGLEVAGLGVSHLAADRETSYRFRARLRWIEGEIIAEPIMRRAMVTGVAVRVFEQDPASWRDPARPFGRGHDELWGSTRVTRDLDRFRIDAAVPAELESKHGDFRVRNCPRFVRSDPDNEEPRKIAERAAGHPPRSDDQSAVDAYYNFTDIFEVMRGLGLVPKLYFRACQLPVSVFYRSGVRPGPGKSGRTVNAWVRLRKPETKGLTQDLRLPIEVHLALANLSRRWRDPDRPSKNRWGESLGIAACERWIMHEFGHVLIAAACGSDPPEFRFAHSLGDGLAAVWADPMSRHANQQDPVAVRLRGYTFPWVFASRRHDREVGKGWSWSGSFQLPVTEAPEIGIANYKSYLSEQILSTTLFRVYRCLGGDTLTYDRQQPDANRRRAASHVVLYLAMRAIESLGHVPLRAEELEAAMIDADVGLTTPLRDPMNPSSKLWVGGRAHKVVRWAFEAQGMHPPMPNAIHNAPGTPPPVDIYVSDRRQNETPSEPAFVSADPGNYQPVSLDWSETACWYSDRDPRIGNRGNQPATDIRVRFWRGILAATTPSRGDLVTKSTIRWVEEKFGQQREPLAGGEARALPLPFDFPSEADGEENIVLIELSCADDRANTDPLARLPTAVARMADLPTDPRELADLVATDNNLGLWRERLAAIA
jgi:hypothetical protein